MNVIHSGTTLSKGHTAKIKNKGFIFPLNHVENHY